jgi:hypothetical protein
LKIDFILPNSPNEGFWAVGRQYGNNPADRRSELGECTKNGVIGNFGPRIARLGELADNPTLRTLRDYFRFARHSPTKSESGSLSHWQFIVNQGDMSGGGLKEIL